MKRQAFVIKKTSATGVTIGQVLQVIYSQSDLLYVRPTVTGGDFWIPKKSLEEVPVFSFRLSLKQIEAISGKRNTAFVTLRLSDCKTNCSNIDKIKPLLENDKPVPVLLHLFATSKSYSKHIYSFCLDCEKAITVIDKVPVFDSNNRYIADKFIKKPITKITCGAKILETYEDFSSRNDLQSE